MDLMDQSQKRFGHDAVAPTPASPLWPRGDAGVAATRIPARQGLYDPRFEHDSCGVGFICHIKGKAHNKIVSQALEMLENMNHRGACGCEIDSGDGAGIMASLPDKFFRRESMKWGFKLPKYGEYGVAMCFLPKEL